MAFLNFPILLVSFLPEAALVQISYKFSILLFWLENIIYVTCFFAFEIVLIPFVYIKMLVVIPWATMGLFTSIFYECFWFIGGIVILIFMAFRDLYHFLLILSMHNGCRENQAVGDEEDNGKDEVKRRVFNEVRTEVIKLYFQIKKDRQGLVFTQEEEEAEKKRDFENTPILAMLEED